MAKELTTRRYRVLITGSRTWTDEDEIYRQLIWVMEEPTKPVDQFVLVSGACPRGADAIGERIAVSLGWELELHPADWDTYGRNAGFRRNREMVDSRPDFCLAFIMDGSRGASHTVNLATQRGIPRVVITRTSRP